MFTFIIFLLLVAALIWIGRCEGKVLHYKRRFECVLRQNERILEENIRLLRDREQTHKPQLHKLADYGILEVEEIE